MSQLKRRELNDNSIITYLWVEKMATGNAKQEMSQSGISAIEIFQKLTCKKVNNELKELLKDIVDKKLRKPKKNGNHISHYGKMARC